MKDEDYEEHYLNLLKTHYDIFRPEIRDAIDYAIMSTGTLKRIHALESAILEICDSDQQQKIIKIMKELKEKTEGGKKK